MKTFIKTLILSSSVSVVLFSCSSSNFHKQKYTDFKNGDGQSKNHETPKSETNAKAKISKYSFENGEQGTKTVLTQAKTENTETEKSKTEAHFNEPFVDQAHENSNLAKQTSENKFKGFKRKAINPLKGADDDNDYGFLAVIIMILLCIFIPPLAVLIADGLKGPFWLNLLLCILAGSAYGLWGTTGALLALLAIIHAFIIVF